jgi:putative peptidoglycan lipid II flippase
VLNVFLVPVLQHAALTLTIAIGALVNSHLAAGRPDAPRQLQARAGLGQVRAAGAGRHAAAGGLLVWGSQHFDWIGLREHRLARIGLLAALIAASALLYFAVLAAAGVRPAQLHAPLNLHRTCADPRRPSSGAPRP